MASLPYWEQTLTSRLKAKSKVVCYTADQIPHVWEEVKPHIQKALDRGSRYGIEDIRRGLCRGKMQLWVWQSDKIDAALVTTIQTKEVKFCLYLALGGSKMSEWKYYMSFVEDWAREQGCTEMRVYGRSGWAKPFGFTIDYTKMSKRI